MTAPPTAPAAAATDIRSLPKEIVKRAAVAPAAAEITEIAGTATHMTTKMNKRIITLKILKPGWSVCTIWANNEKATQKVLKPGPLPGENLLHTGDLFRSDDEGFLYFVGRKDDIIKSRGEKVAPKEVETVLHELPGVSEAVVIGLPDPVLGHAVNAVIVLAGGATVDKRDLLRHCRQRLEDFAVPVGFEFRDELPKTANGKVDRRLLGEMLMQEAQRHDPDPDSPASRPERTQ